MIFLQMLLRSGEMLRRLFKKKYVCVRQYDLTDCGAACLSSIAQYYGLKMSLAKIREMTGTDTQAQMPMV